MTQTQTAPPAAAPRIRAGTEIVVWLRELGECREGGLISDEDFGYQRAEKLDELLHAPRHLWLGPFLGAMVTGAIGGCTTWWFTGDWRYTAAVIGVAGLWGTTSLGRMFREKFTEIQLRERMNIFLALLENDLICAEEFAGYEARLAEGRQGTP